MRLIRSRQVHTLRKRRDFVRLNRGARRIHQEGFIVQLMQNTFGSDVRLGITVSKKVGNAVKRNLIKRRFREVIRHQLPEFSTKLSGYDLVLIAKPQALAIRYAALCSHFRQALKKGLRHDKPTKN